MLIPYIIHDILCSNFQFELTDTRRIQGARHLDAFYAKLSRAIRLLRRDRATGSSYCSMFFHDVARCVTKCRECRTKCSTKCCTNVVFRFLLVRVFASVAIRNLERRKKWPKWATLRWVICYSFINYIRRINLISVAYSAYHFASWCNVIIT